MPANRLLIRLAVVCSYSVLIGYCQCNQPLPCPDSNELSVAVDVQKGLALVSNGHVCLSVACGKVSVAKADFSGQGRWQANILATGGVCLESEDSNGKVSTSANQSPQDLSISIKQNSSDAVAVQIAGVATASKSAGGDPEASEDWEIVLQAGERHLSLQVTGETLRNSSLRSVRRSWHMQPSSIYGLFKGGVVQMKGAPGGKDFYPSEDSLLRVYGVGGPGTEADAVGNTSFDIVFPATPPQATTQQTVLMSSSSGDPYWSGLQQVVAGGLPASSLDTWMLGWQGAPPTDVFAGGKWANSMYVGFNSLDFPVGTLGSSPVSTVDRQRGRNGQTATAEPLPQDDAHAMLMGVYASPVGNLCTHMNEVATGQSVGQIATTIARPDRGYANTYNYFDPDNYLSTAAMLWSNDPYLQEQVRVVVERSGDFLLPSGQLPHHFLGTKPVYQALSGEIQTGPNVFWILSALNYAQSSQNTTWLEGYMPKLRQASEFLFGLIDPAVGMANVPGSLMIDVFIRNNFTSDTNAMLVGFFKDFAVAEEFVGNATGASKLRALADRVAASMNDHLWASSSAGADHYVTQWDGPALNTTRDFVDYDSNLIAAAHGIPSPSRLSAIFGRIDGGRCRPSQTFVSEKWYGPGDTTHGNTGDSWTAMGRIAWFEALARQRGRDAHGFNSFLLTPLQQQLLNHTWMHERQFCDGTQQLNRTWAYFEYPAVVSMLLRHVKYGIQQGISSFTVDPLGPSSFEYRIGNIYVLYTPQAVSITAPGRDRTGLPPINVTIGGLLPSTVYDLQAQAAALVSGMGGVLLPPLQNDALQTCSVGSASASSDAEGTLSFHASLGLRCVIAAAASASQHGTANATW